MHADAKVRELSDELTARTIPYRYTYNFSWLGVPIIQFPDDIVALSEIVWNLKPDLVIETGIAHGGSLIFYASMLQLIGGEGRVLGVDIDIRSHNRAVIESHPLAHRIDMIQGSSIDPEIVARVASAAAGKRVLVVLDSNHTGDHVLAELRAYSPLVREGGYLVVLDTIVEKLPDELYADRPWSVGDNPMTAVHQFLKENDRFVIDEEYDSKLLLTVAPDGYLRCVKDPN
ncbi:MAG: cephalosporin hydroxylase family protein [Candidatus Eremiobacteraeota bacterium]|nr:cephalosporin hydroxylase family protein [Candidatus Eremiobacteraeota bacterium]